MKLKQKANKNYPRLKKGTTTYLTLIKLRDIEEKIASRITFFITCLLYFAVGSREIKNGGSITDFFGTRCNFPHHFR